MNHAFIDVYRVRLEIKREDFQHRIECARQRVSQCGTADWSTDTAEAVQGLMEDTRPLLKIETALAAIADGDYGRCRLCQHEIGSRRLERIPWTAHCETCRNLADTRIKRRTLTPAHRNRGGAGNWVRRWLSNAFYASFHDAR